MGDTGGPRGGGSGAGDRWQVGRSPGSVRYSAGQGQDIDRGKGWGMGLGREQESKSGERGDDVRRGGAADEAEREEEELLPINPAPGRFRRKTQQEIKREAEERFRREHTFSPRLHSSAAVGRSGISGGNRASPRAGRSASAARSREVQPPALPSRGEGGTSGERATAGGRFRTREPGTHGRSASVQAGRAGAGRRPAGGGALRAVLAKSEAASSRAGRAGSRARARRGEGPNDGGEQQVTEEERRAARARLYGDKRGVWAQREAQRRKKEAEELRRIREGGDVSGAGEGAGAGAAGQRHSRAGRSSSVQSPSRGPRGTRGERTAPSGGMAGDLAVVRRSRRSVGRGRGTGAGGGRGEDPERAAAAAASRLYGEAEQRRRRRQRLLDERRAAETEGCTFKPRLHSTSTAVLDMEQYVPLRDRIDDLQRARAANVHRMRMERLVQDKDLRFQPAINRKSAALAEQRQEATQEGGKGGGGQGASEGGQQVPVEQRLQEEARRREQRHRARQQQRALQQAKQHSFQPRIDARSKRMVEESATLGSRGFEGRLEVMERERERRAAVRRAEGAQDRQCTFKPDIGNAAAVLRRTGRGNKETPEERAERMSKQEAERVTRARQAMQEEYYGQFEHRPQIDGVSRAIGRARTVEEHSEDAEARQRREALRLQAKEREREECTFRPTLESNPDRVLRRAGPGADARRLRVREDPEGISDRVRRLQEDRARRVEERRREAEYKELEACPFQPGQGADKPRPVAQPKGPVVVRGLGRHMEARRRADEQRRERQRREEEAFAVKRPAGAAVLGEDGWAPTRPQGPRLTTAEETARRDARRLRTEREAREAAEGECTFQPKTVEGAGRQYVDALLEAEETVAAVQGALQD